MDASRERGAAAVEFALIVPLLVTFLFGIIEGGSRYAQQNEVNHWAFLAARDLSIDPTKSATTIVTTLKGSDPQTYTVTVSPASLCTSAANNQVTVTVTTTRTSASGLFPDYQIKGKGVARCES